MINNHHPGNILALRFVPHKSSFFNIFARCFIPEETDNYAYGVQASLVYGVVLLPGGLLKQML